MKVRTYTEYRVLCKRVGNNVSDRRMYSLKAVTDRVGILTSDEPWRFFGDEIDRERDGDELVCCQGTAYDQCACGGLTLRQQSDEVRKNLPPIEWVKVEKRTVTRSPWEPIETSVAKPAPEQGASK